MEKMKISQENIVIRRAKIKDVKSIYKILLYFGKRDMLLPRPLMELYENIQNFWVAERNNKVIGCCSLHVVSEDLAEIRSLAVLPKYQNRGIGKRLIYEVVREMKNIGLKKTFVLTFNEKYFKKIGFRRVAREKLPHKIWRDCINCHLFPECDEKPLIVKIDKIINKLEKKLCIG